MSKKIRVGMIGLGFGAEFIPIYQDHPLSECVAISRRDPHKLKECAQTFGVKKTYTDYREMLNDPDIDAIHITTDIPTHAEITKAALKAGKHVACTVPMAVSVEECKEIVQLEEETGKVYMMMETAVYTREFLYVKQKYERGEMGNIQFVRGAHQQNMSLPGWPDYWYGLPPMYYPTHAISPMSAILNRPIEHVWCLGSGRIKEDDISRYHSPFAVETAHFTFRNSVVSGEATRSLFETIRQYRESFDVYGTNESFEWEQCIGDDPVIYSGYEDAERVEVPDTDQMLPKEIAPYCLKEKILDKGHVSFLQGSGHGGSHPHLVHEFLNAIQEDRKSSISAKVAANWTVAGLIAHESAMKDGEKITMPEFTQF